MRKSKPGDKQIIPRNYQPDQDRRRHVRKSLDCPIVVYTPTGRRELLRSRTDNLSNGGCYVTIEKNIESRWVWLPQQPDESPLVLELRIPRQTPNTYMLEPVRSAARIVRIEKPPLNQPLSSAGVAELGLALQFKNPLELQLE